MSWVDAGAPKGDDKDLPPAPKFTEGWEIGQPDLVLSMKEEHTVPADGVIPYLYFRIPTNFTEDRWVQAVEIKPGDRRVVHHVIATAWKTRGEIGSADSAASRPTRRAIISPPGTRATDQSGRGHRLADALHDHGEATKDRTSVGLIFAKERAKIVLHGGNAMNMGFVIPAGAPNHEVRASKTFKEDTYLYSLMPHMHVRGKDFTYTAVYPDGRSEVILSVPKYDFNWQFDLSCRRSRIACRKARGSIAWPISTTRPRTSSTRTRRRTCAGATRPGKR